MNPFKIVTFLLLPLIIFTQTDEEKTQLRKFISDAMTAYSEEDYPKAIEFFKQAFVLRPENSAIAYNISCCYVLSGEKDGALTWLEKTVELGTYKFSDDEDLASYLKDDVRYQKLLTWAEQRIKELESKEWKPVIVLPENFDKEKDPAIIALHGFGSNPIDFSSALEPAIRPSGHILCCPYGTEIRGTTSFGWGDYEVVERRVFEAHKYMKENYKINTKKFIILGYSQGGVHAFFTGLKNPKFFSAIITVAGAYDDEFNEFLESKEARKLKVYMMIGEYDDFLESNYIAENRMFEHGLKVKLIVYPRLGHAFPPGSKQELEKALEWIKGSE